MWKSINTDRAHVLRWSCQCMKRTFVSTATHPLTTSDTIFSSNRHLANITCLPCGSRQYDIGHRSRAIVHAMSLVRSKWLLNIARECKFDVSDLNSRLFEYSHTIRNLFILFMIVSFNVSYRAMFVWSMFRICHLQWIWFSSRLHWHLVVCIATSNTEHRFLRRDFCIPIHFHRICWPIYDQLNSLQTILWITQPIT